MENQLQEIQHVLWGYIGQGDRSQIILREIKRILVRARQTPDETLCSLCGGPHSTRVCLEAERPPKKSKRR